MWLVVVTVNSEWESGARSGARSHFRVRSHGKFWRTPCSREEAGGSRHLHALPILYLHPISFDTIEMEKPKATEATLTGEEEKKDDVSPRPPNQVQTKAAAPSTRTQQPTLDTTTINNNANDVVDTAVRNMALWRMIFFSIMMYEWSKDQVLTPFGKLNNLELNLAQGSTGKDRWFAYNQFEWIQDLHAWLGQDANLATALDQGGLLLCFLAAFGKELRIPGWTWYSSLFTILYMIEFLAKATNFTNHNYLFPLLMILTIFSGGGTLFGKPITERERKSCQAAIVALRCQLAVMYIFASLWKIHPDWFAGRIVRRIFLSFQATNKARGIPWDAVGRNFPQVFVILAVGGFLLDASMATVLTLGKPTPASTKLFLTFTLIFHLSTSISMAQMIGYAFPGTCIAGLVLFLPLAVQHGGGDKVESYDMALVSWLYRYALRVSNSWKQQPTQSQTTMTAPKSRAIYPARWQMWLVLAWVAWQLYMPLRMLAISGGDFAYNRLAYRYSWTMMLHDLDYGIMRQSEGSPDRVLLLSYYVPTCFLRNGHPDMFLPRTLYFGQESEHPMQDSRTVPMHQILGNRESAMLEVFPTHLISRVGDGIAQAVDVMVGGRACDKITSVPPNVKPLDPRLGMHAVYFGRLNGNGPYSRLIDPTVDLVAVMEAQRNQSYATTLLNAFLDRRPAGQEFVLRQGIGSLRQAAFKYEAELKLHYPDKTIHFISDRASCLDARPLWFAPLGNPYAFVPLRLPYKTSLSLKYADIRVGPDVTHTDLSLGDLAVVASTTLEIGIKGLHKEISKPCGETTDEDVLIAVLF